MNGRSTGTQTSVIPSDRATSLLSKYPEISPEESRELIDFFQRGAILDRGNVAGRPDLAPKFEAFQAEHRRAFQVGLTGYLWLLLLSVLFGLMIWFLWDIGVK